MSFILDALKKSENERQRHSGPALFEVKVATPRPGLPLWAVALAALLVVNIGVVIWLVAQPATANHAVARARACEWNVCVVGLFGIVTSHQVVDTNLLPAAL